MPEFQPTRRLPEAFEIGDQVIITHNPHRTLAVMIIGDIIYQAHRADPLIWLVRYTDPSDGAIRRDYFGEQNLTLANYSTIRHAITYHEYAMSELGMRLQALGRRRRR